MQFVLQQTSDGRWQIWRCDVVIAPDRYGDWIGTYRPRAVGLAVAKLVHAVQLAGTARLPKRSKGSGG